METIQIPPLGKTLFGRTAPNILVVDDTAANLKLMVAILKNSGYLPRPVTSGALALEAARRLPPDLVLLDINMPDMDGYEVCKRFKADETLSAIPIIFLSARETSTDKVMGLRGGGIDYVTKPFQADDLLARIDTHLELHRLRMELKKKNEWLDKMVRERTQQLVEARDHLAILNRTKSEFLALISHEIRTPLNGLNGIAELIFDLSVQTPKSKKLEELYKYSRARLLSILDDALLLTQIEFQKEGLSSMPICLTEALHAAIEKVQAPLKFPRAVFGAVPEFPGPIDANPEMLAIALEGFLETAAKFSKNGLPVELSTQVSEKEIHLAILSEGYSIPEKFLSRIFDVMAIKEAIIPGGDLGLKLPLSERIMALMGGAATIQNSPPHGIQLNVFFKRYAESDSSSADASR